VVLLDVGGDVLAHGHEPGLGSPLCDAVLLAAAARLQAAGRAGSTPALVVENASRADERRVVTTLSGLPDAAAGLAGPALLIVGEAMALARSGEASAEVETLIREARA